MDPLHKMHEHFSMYRETWREVGYVFLHCIKLTCLAEMFPKSIAELGPARLTEPKFDFGHFAVNPVMATEWDKFIRTVPSEQRCELLP